MPLHPLTVSAFSILLLFSVNSTALADEDPAPPEDPLLGWSITPGIGVRVVSLDVTRKSDGYTGTLTNDGSFTDPIYLSLDIETPSWMVSKAVGFSIRSHSQTFRLTRQEIPSSTSTSGQDYADLGTSVQGYYSYLGPTVFYRMVDPSGDSRFGLGYGYWKAWFHGDIVLAPDGAATAGMPSVSIDGSIDGSTGPIFFMQARGKRGVLEIALSSVSFSGLNYRFSLRELNMSIGYIVTF